MGEKLGTPTKIWSVETSTSLDALKGSAFELDQEVVNDTLQRLKMPEDAGELQIVGDLPGSKMPSRREGELTFHYLPVLPSSADATADNFSHASLFKANRNAAIGLANLVDYHRSELGMLYSDEETLFTPGNRKIGATALGGMSLFLTNGLLVSASAEAGGHAWISLPIVLGTGAVFLYGFEKYRETVRLQEEQAEEREVTKRERLIADIASGPPLIVPRQDAQF